MATAVVAGFSVGWALAWGGASAPRFRPSPRTGIPSLVPLDDAWQRLEGVPPEGGKKVATFASGSFHAFPPCISTMRWLTLE
jgi:hypothetical protein